MKKIVIIDDEFIILQGLKHLLEWENYGYEVVLDTQSSEIALNYLQNNPVDIVLSDIVMPEMDGLKLLEIIKSNFPKVHVVMISSHSDFEYTRTALRLGASDYILKAMIKPEQVLNVLNDLKIDSSESLSLDYSHLINKELTALIHSHDAKTPILDSSFKLDFFTAVFYNKKHHHSLDELKQNTFNESVTLEEDIALILNTKKPITEFPEGPYFYSSPLQSLQDIQQVYKDYEAQRDRIFYDPNKPLHIIPNFTWPQRPSYHDKEAFNMVASSKFYHSFDKLHAYFMNVLNQEIYNPLELKSFLSNIIYQFINQIEKHKIQSTHIASFKLQMIYQIQSADSKDSLAQEFSTIMSNLSIIIQNYLNDEGSQLKDQLHLYLSDNYMNNLSLDDVAHHFNFSYHYMSELFNQSFNESFNDVLNKLRISKSQSLLRDTDLSLKEVCAQVGFSNYSHFSKIFRKLTNTSPTDYRKNYHV